MKYRSDRGAYSQAEELLEKAFSAGLPMHSYYSDLSYLLVLSKEYQRLIDLKVSHRDKLTKIDNSVFEINFQYAAKVIGSEKYKAHTLRNIVANTSDQTLKLGAFSVLGQENDVKRILSEKISNCFSYYFLFRRWPIMSKEVIDTFFIEAA